MNRSGATSTQGGFTTFDRAMMRRALRLAARGIGLVSPNPMVGAVLVRDGSVIATGFHHRHGADHAEIDALKKVGFSAAGCTLYVNLEPCCHHGKTPPCTNSVVSSGIARVVIGTTDPNPLVAGRGAEYLRAAGLEVSVGLLEEECRELNRAFFKWIRTMRPFVTVKIASTIDGRIADRNGMARWITGPASRTDVHRMRAELDCVLIGGQTARRDDPLLLPVMVRARRNPLRVVLTGNADIPLDSRLLNSLESGCLLVYASFDAPEARVNALVERGVEVCRVASAFGSLDLAAVLDDLGNRQVTSVLVEAGSSLATAFIARGLADRLVVYYAPRVLGDPSAIGMVDDMGNVSLAQASQFRLVSVRRFEDDVRLEFEPAG
jgi:diaminohydroxyphosphoribosylaminopyrimidine deaminase/5-amino-6-(5-phosphoribosylamino)uracil reductase